MKKIITLFTLCIITLSFVACGSQNANNIDSPSSDNTPDSEAVFFEATVLEVAENSLLVEPAENSSERKSSDRISVSLSGLDSSQSDTLLQEIIASDIVEIEYNGAISESYPAQITGLSVRKISDAPADALSSVDTPASIDKPEPEDNEFVRMAMVNDKLFVDTGESSALVKKCGNMDFNFDSSVEQGTPTENYQTNFGIGYGGQYGMRENRIEIYFDNEWHIFSYNENNLDGVSMEITEYTNHSLTLEVSNNTDLTVQYGDYYTLEMFDEEIDTWVLVPYADSEIGIHDLAYMPKKNEPVSWSVDWTQMYGELNAGTYRIVKTVDVLHETGGFTSYTLMAEFEITE